MTVRVWGVVGERLIEVRARKQAGLEGVVLEGLPPDRVPTTRDRVRAALVNSGIVPEAPSVRVTVAPPLLEGGSADMDLAIALSALVAEGKVGSGLGWILARGRLGLDGTVHGPGPSDRLALGEVVQALCHTPVVGFERMFERLEG